MDEISARLDSLEQSILAAHVPTDAEDEKKPVVPVIKENGEDIADSSKESIEA